jgi:iron complex transport system permease protein
VLGLCGVFLLLLVGAVLFAVRFGEQPVSLTAVFTDATSSDATIFWSVRLPRVLLAALVGAGLAASGSTLQGVLRNPLADPFVLGVSGGAALGATVSIALGLSTVGQVVPGSGGWLEQLSAPAFFAFVGAVGSILFVLGASRGHGRYAPISALLIGVIFNAFASAVITLIKVISDPHKVKDLLHFLTGSLTFEPPGTLAFFAVLQAVAIGVMLALSGRLNLLTLGDEDAASLGVPVARTRRVLLLATSASVAGRRGHLRPHRLRRLIVPHVLRLVFGPDQRLLVPLSAVGGALFLVLADLLARLAYPLFNQELPVGSVTALLGGPLFLALLYRRGRLALGL